MLQLLLLQQQLPEENSDEDRISNRIRLTASTILICAAIVQFSLLSFSVNAETKVNELKIKLENSRKELVQADSTYQRTIRIFDETFDETFSKVLEF